MKKYKFRCTRCGIVVESDTIPPERKLVGPCTQVHNGEHYWYKIWG